jgi:hypothetical protein
MKGLDCCEVSETTSKSWKGPVGKMIENIMNLRHSCIADVIDIVDRSDMGRLRIVRNHVSGISLSKVITTSPEWWTATSKVKAIVGIVSVLRLAYSFGMVHRHLTGDKLLFNDEGEIEINGFCMKDSV